jgi:hypothetical protein
VSEEGAVRAQRESSQGFLWLVGRLRIGDVPEFGEESDVGADFGGLAAEGLAVCEVGILVAAVSGKLKKGYAEVHEIPP